MEVERVTGKQRHANTLPTMPVSEVAPQRNAEGEALQIDDLCKRLLRYTTGSGFVPLQLLASQLKSHCSPHLHLTGNLPAIKLQNMCVSLRIRKVNYWLVIDKCNRNFIWAEKDPYIIYSCAEYEWQQTAGGLSTILITLKNWERHRAEGWEDKEERQQAEKTAAKPLRMLCYQTLPD